MSQHLQTVILSNPQRSDGGVMVRTGLRGGLCVDVNDQVITALQTLTNALGGSATAAAAPTTTAAVNTTATSS